MSGWFSPLTEKIQVAVEAVHGKLFARMLPPHSQSVYQISRQEGIPVNTLYGWRSQAGIPALSVANDGQCQVEWVQDARLAVLVETAPLSAHAVAEYCRRKGIYPEQIQQRSREIARKEKALAEAGALLILEKKLKAFFDKER